jgi:phospholipid/cholesterol/gamma-HCH transport system substrate-binding protein
MSSSPQSVLRAALAVGALLALAICVLVLTGGSDYRLHARFPNAGLLIAGDRVEIAGRKVGHVAHVGLARNGLADVELKIEDDDAAPLHDGTRVEIRAVGQAGIANRLVDVIPGPTDARALDDGAVLGVDRTSPIVNVDALLGSFGPKRRAAMRTFIERSDEIYAGSGGPAFNAMLRKLAPASAELSGFYGEVARDDEALARLVRTADDAAGAIASRRGDLVSAVDTTARAFGAIAGERAALQDMLTRAPGVLTQARGTLARARMAVTTLRPALREVPAAARPLGPYLRDLDATLPRARTVVDDLRGQIPALRATLRGLSPIAAPVVRALQTTGRAMLDSRQIFEGLRLYGSDMVIGLLAGLGGVPTGPYDALGHYAKVEFVESPQTAVEGRLGNLLNLSDLVPGILGVRTGATRRCPGGNQPPSPDGSSPWDLGEKICSHEDDILASVNER